MIWLRRYSELLVQGALMLVVLLAIITFVYHPEWLGLPGYDGPSISNADRLNELCRGHGGVRSYEGSTNVVFCLDGKAVDR